MKDDSDGRESTCGELPGSEFYIMERECRWEWRYACGIADEIPTFPLLRRPNRMSLLESSSCRLV